MLLEVTTVLLLVSAANSQTDGEVLDKCVLRNSGEESVCVLLHECDEAKRGIKQNRFPQHCGFIGIEPIVCCPGYIQIQKKQKKNVNIGDLARKACAGFYGLHLEAKGEPGCYLNSRGVIECFVSGGTLVIDFKDFKHMALVGFLDDGNKNWQCGGSLISEEYVLTAAHCLNSRELGEVKYVRLGDLNYTTDNDNTTYQDFTITRIIRHPNYTYVSNYNDIALLKLDRAAVFSDFVKPACLHTQTDIDQGSGVLMIAGWGQTQYNEDRSSQLRKAVVEVVPHENCSKIYPQMSRSLKQGIVNKLQVCAGSYDESNTCQGDSGGPLQLEATVENKTLSFIVGVTSTGKACGFAGVPGIYTRVSNYIDWIEDIVWKQ